MGMNGMEDANITDDARTQSDVRVHMFICTNRRSNQRSCGGSNSTLLLEYARVRLRAVLEGGGKGVLVSRSGCLGKCHTGPVLVIYPEGVWYRIQSTQDIDEVLESHIKNGDYVERLLIDSEKEQLRA